MQGSPVTKNMKSVTLLLSILSLSDTCNLLQYITKKPCIQIQRPHLQHPAPGLHDLTAARLHGQSNVQLSDGLCVAALQLQLCLRASADQARTLSVVNEQLSNKVTHCILVSEPVAFKSRGGAGLHTMCSNEQLSDRLTHCIPAREPNAF